MATGIDPNKVIFNFSSYVLSDIEMKVLSRGLEFCVQPSRLDFCAFLRHLKN